jgi:hypothetical protein
MEFYTGNLSKIWEDYHEFELYQLPIVGISLKNLIHTIWNYARKEFHRYSLK